MEIDHEVCPVKCGHRLCENLRTRRRWLEELAELVRNSVGLEKPTTDTSVNICAGGVGDSLESLTARRELLTRRKWELQDDMVAVDAELRQVEKAILESQSR